MVKNKETAVTGGGSIDGISKTAALLVNHEAKSDSSHATLPMSSQSSTRGGGGGQRTSTTARSALSASPKLTQGVGHSSSSSSSSSSSHTASTRLSTSTGVTLSLELDREAVRRILAHSSLLSEAQGLGANLASQNRSAEASLVALHAKATNCDPHPYLLLRPSSRGEPCSTNSSRRGV